MLYPNQLTAIVKSNVDGEYTIIIGEGNYDVTVRDGYGNVSFTLPANTYVARVVSKTNSSLENSTTFTVYPKEKLTPDIRSSEVIDKSDVVISIEMPKDIDNENVTVILNDDIAKQATIKNGKANAEFKNIREFSLIQ